MNRISHIKGDLVGGASSAIIPLPKAMALGALVFAPLGPDYLALGILAGVISLIFGNVVSAPLGSVPIMHNAPYSLSSFLVLGALNSLVVYLQTDIGSVAQVTLAVTALFMMVSFSGLIQIVLGYLKIGDLAKYIPYPVTAGLLNGSAILIFVSQAKVILGISGPLVSFQFLNWVENFNAVLLVVGGIACLATLYGKKISKAIPAPVFGVTLGAVAFYAAKYYGLGDGGDVVGPIPSAMPSPDYAMNFAHFASQLLSLDLFLHLAPYALGIAAINSLRTLIICSVCESEMLTRFDANRELIAQGASNVVNGMFGGISTAGSLPATLANYRGGARSSVSRLAAGVLPFLVILVLHPFVSGIPVVALAGLLLVVAVQSLDAWSLRLVGSIVPALRAGDNHPAINAFLVLTVTLTLLFFGIIEALASGLVVSILWFLLRLSSSAIRSEFSGDIVRSSTQRSPDECSALDQHGNSIQILVLEGSLFFGTADKVADTVERRVTGRNTKFVILDLERITDIDTTGAKIIHKLHKSCASNEASLILCWSRKGAVDSVSTELSQFFTSQQMQAFCFSDIEVALAVAEDRLLDQLIYYGRYAQEIDLSAVDSFSLFDAQEIEILNTYLECQNYPSGSQIYSQGASGDAAYFVVKGRARVFQHRSGNSDQRLATIPPGGMFGEMAFLDKQPRSGYVIAIGDLSCYRLSNEALAEISETHPRITEKLLIGIGKEMSARLRIANKIRATLTI